jgi:hypothetical protein
MRKKAAPEDHHRATGIVLEVEFESKQVLDRSWGPPVQEYLIDEKTTRLRNL